MARTDAKMVFTTLLSGPGLSSAERARARRLVSSSFRATSVEQNTMLSRAGWKIIEHVDVTPDYAETARRQLRAYESRAKLASEVLGGGEFERRLTSKREYIQAIDEGLLRRELFVAVV